MELFTWELITNIVYVYVSRTLLCFNIWISWQDIYRTASKNLDNMKRVMEELRNKITGTEQHLSLIHI